jgi:hypothetical protein
VGQRVQLRETRPDLGILLLSQAVETRYAAQLLERHPDGFGYLLKDRVVDVETLMTALRTGTAGSLPYWLLFAGQRKDATRRSP